MLDSLYRSTKTFTLLLKSKILNFETLSRVHVYRIEYVSYWQGPYRICIETAADRIVPAIVNTCTRESILPDCDKPYHMI